MGQMSLPNIRSIDHLSKFSAQIPLTPPTMSQCTHFAEIGRLPLPKLSDSVHREECTQCFDNQACFFYYTPYFLCLLEGSSGLRHRRGCLLELLQWWLLEYRAQSRFYSFSEIGTFFHSQHQTQTQTHGAAGWFIILIHRRDHLRRNRWKMKNPPRR